MGAEAEADAGWRGAASEPEDDDATRPEAWERAWLSACVMLTRASCAGTGYEVVRLGSRSLERVREAGEDEGRDWYVGGDVSLGAALRPWGWRCLPKA